MGSSSLGILGWEIFLAPTQFLVTQGNRAYRVGNPWFCAVVLDRIRNINMLNCFKDFKSCIHIDILGFYSTEEDQIHSGATLHVAYPVLSIQWNLSITTT